MQKVSLFLILLIVSLGSLIILVFAMFYFLPTSSTQPDWMNDMWSHMGGMMGGGGKGGAEMTKVKSPDFSGDAASFVGAEKSLKRMARQAPEDEKGNTKIGGVF